MIRRLPLALAATSWPGVALAAELDGRTLGLAWGLPFAGMLLSIALLPVLAPHFWEHHYPKVSAFWALLLVTALAFKAGAAATLGAVLHTALIEYIPFILLLLALFTVAGGIIVRGNIHGSPATNTALLALGAGLASLIGTTGASMVMVRPVIRANDDRRFNVHVVVFFIFLVSNIGGSLTPLRDPPLFLGFLRGVNFIPIAVIIAAILASATFDLGIVTVAGIELAVANILRDLTMIAVTAASLAATPRARRDENGFTWGPIREVARLFAAIFITIIPVLAILRAGPDGVLAPV